jgi:hypothetical protein
VVAVGGSRSSPYATFFVWLLFCMITMLTGVASNESRRNQRTAINLACRLRRGVLRMMKCWQDSGDGSTPAELRSQAHRLLSEIDCLNGASSEILDKLRPVAPATASILSYKYERTQ